VNPNIRFLTVLLAGALASCKGTDNPGTPTPALIFDRDVRASYAEVRECRYPGEHSALAAFTVWISRDAEPAFRGLWADPPTETRLPPGAVVVKEIYESTECTPDAVERWVAMKKEPGLDPDHADWHWQEVTATGEVSVDGPDPACIDCHRGGDQASCAGYGELAGLDYLCTAE